MFFGPKRTICVVFSDQPRESAKQTNRNASLIADSRCKHSLFFYYFTTYEHASGIKMISEVSAFKLPTLDVVLTSSTIPKKAFSLHGRHRAIKWKPCPAKRHVTLIIMRTHSHKDRANDQWPMLTVNIIIMQCLTMKLVQYYNPYISRYCFS